MVFRENESSVWECKTLELVWHGDRWEVSGFGSHDTLFEGEGVFLIHIPEGEEIRIGGGLLAEYERITLTAPENRIFIANICEGELFINMASDIEN